MTASSFYTRVSLGSQIRGALDNLVERGIIVGWTLENNDLVGMRYVLEDDRMFAYYSPGNCANMLNAIGFDIQIGKNPQASAAVRDC